MELTNPARNALLNGLIDLLDEASGVAKLSWRNNTSTEFQVTDLQSPSFGAPAAGEAGLAGVPLDSTGASGNYTLAECALLASDNELLATLTVGESDADIIIGSVLVGEDDVIRIEALTLEMPASDA